MNKAIFGKLNPGCESGFDKDFFPQRNKELLARITDFVERVEKEMTSDYWWEDRGKSQTFKTLKPGDIDFATDLACFCFQDICQSFYTVTSDTQSGNERHLRHLMLLRALLRKPLALSVETLLKWMEVMRDISERSAHGSKSPQSYKTMVWLSEWPLAYIIQLILKKAKKAPLTEAEIQKVRALLDWQEFRPGYQWFDATALRVRINELLDVAAPDGRESIPYTALKGDNFGAAVEAHLASMSDTDALNWHKIMHLAARAVGSRPTAKFRAKAESLAREIGKEKLRAALQTMVQYALKAQVCHRPWQLGDYFGYEEVFFTKENSDLLKGLAWIATLFQDNRTVNLLADFYEKSIKKYSGNGSINPTIANACLIFLENTPGAEATARISRLSNVVKQKSDQIRVAEIIAKRAEAAGITSLQLAERTVPDYGLSRGEKTVAFDDYGLRITAHGPGKLTQTWLTPAGKVQKTRPKFVTGNAAHKARFDKLTAEVAALKKALTAQRDRIDRLFAEDIEWPLNEVERYYVNHDLLCTIATRLVWSLHSDGRAVAALWRDGGWQDLSGAPVATSDDTTARLWHPIDADVDVVLAWRARIAELGIMQPMKQVYREVYRLTDAERKTGTYSNRMAAHMLKQHQMAALMGARGWHYSLMGAYDDGKDDQWARKSFVTHDLSAEYLLHTNWDQDNFNDAGIYFYVGTDQIRFVKDGAPVPLVNVPPRLFSEIMREADLFVGVASVGNDPLWIDQGPTPAARNYWQDYSFGKLDGFAETRAQVLNTLLPRLKIRDVAHIEGKFLIVDGKLNTYKIHLGSANILMEPGDRYLCIVPSAVEKATTVTLPFEGDARLSVILSKAIMLAEDSKITAPDITSQLGKGRL